MNVKHIVLFGIFVVLSEGFNDTTDKNNSEEIFKQHYRKALVSVLGFNYYL